MVYARGSLRSVFTAFYHEDVWLISSPDHDFLFHGLYSRIASDVRSGFRLFYYKVLKLPEELDLGFEDCKLVLLENYMIL